VAGSDDSYLCKDELTLNAAQQADEKKRGRKARKAARQGEASDDGDGGEIEGILRIQPSSENKNSASSSSLSPQQSDTGVAGSMTLVQVIDALKEEYSDHDDYDEMITDLNGNDYLDHWANKLCEEEFNRNTGIARSLYALQLEKSENYIDISNLAESIANEEYLNDKVWGKELYQKALDLAEISSDILTIADSVISASSLSDKPWAKSLYENAIEKADNASDYQEIANSVAREENLNDKVWAKILYNKATEKAEEAYEYQSIAEAIAAEESLNDKDWAREVFQKAIDASDSGSDLQSIANSILNEYVLDDKAFATKIMQQTIDYDGLVCSYDATSIAFDLVHSFDDKPWAKTVYQKAIDLCEDDEQRKDVIEAIGNELENKEWADELAQKFGISMPIKTTIVTPECTVYFETIKLSDIDSKDKLKTVLKTFQETAEAESVCYSRADAIESFETEKGEYVDHEIDKKGPLIPSVNDGEVVFVFNYSYLDSSYSVSINNTNNDVNLETYNFGSFDLIKSYSQNGEELEYELDIANNREGIFIGFLSNKSGELQSINLTELFTDGDEDDEYSESKKVDLFYQMLEEEAARQDGASDDGDGGEKDDLDRVLDETMEEDGEDDDEASKYVFMASINLYESVFESEHDEFDFEKEKCPEQIRKIIIDEVSEFCECVSMRLDEGDPCFMIIQNSSNEKEYIRINPEKVIPGKTSRVSASIRTENAKRLAGYTTDNILWHTGEAEVLVAMLVDGCDHWDRNFIKVSQAYPGKDFTIYGWHENSEDYAYQIFDDGDYDSGIESVGGSEYLGEDMLSRYGLTEEDFDINLYN